MRSLKYLKRRDTLFPYCYQALQGRFESIEELDGWYRSLASDEKRNSFLKVASYYLALVKKGDWHVSIPESDPVIEYFTNTFKYISIISLIESLSDAKHRDFYSYLVMRKTGTRFPLEKAALTASYRRYSKEYGSIRRCIGFFKNLSKSRQQALVSKLEAKEVRPTIENFVKYLYQLRSEFVHRAELVHEMSRIPTLSAFGDRMVVCYLSIEDAMEFFEEGLIAWCEK